MEVSVFSTIIARLTEISGGYYQLVGEAWVWVSTRPIPVPHLTDIFSGIIGNHNQTMLTEDE
jgi:hypothetical protein